MPPLHLIGTPFQQEVWALLRQIPYGKKPQHTELWQRPLRRSGDWSECPRRPWAARWGNEISILVPCHRVVGTGGSLTGYAGGVDKKKALLELEGVSMEGLFVPKRGTAL